MKNKVINLFGQSQIEQNKGVKYSVLLEQFITPFTTAFADVEYYDDIFEFAIVAWNFGNMKLLLPKMESDAAINALNGQEINFSLLLEMIDYKTTNFKDYTLFISDFEIKEKNGEPVLSVITQEKDTFFASIEIAEDSEYKENYIDRTAIIINPLQPFLDWIFNLYPNEPEKIKVTNTYLISEDIEDLETWLKKNYSKIFEIELEAWNINKKKWPQKRNYKMFKEWFQVDFSIMVYDFERKPVYKA